MPISSFSLWGIHQSLAEMIRQNRSSGKEIEELQKFVNCQLPRHFYYSADAWYHMPVYLLVGLGEQCKMNIVGEWYPFWFSITAMEDHHLSAQAGPLFDCFKAGYRIILEREWLYLQAAMPAFARALDLPDSDLIQWFRGREMLNIDAAAAIVRRLLIPQVEGLIWLRGDFRGIMLNLNFEATPKLGAQLNQVGVPNSKKIYDTLQDSLEEILIYNNRMILYFYSYLLQTQRSILHNGNPLIYSQLTPAQQMAIRIIAERDGDPSVKLLITSAKVYLSQKEIPVAIRNIFEDMSSAKYIFTPETARELGIPFIRGCQLAIELPGETPDAPIRRLEFPLLLSLK